MDSTTQATVRSELNKAIKEITGISSISVPEGKTPEEMNAVNPNIRWRRADKRVQTLRVEAKESAQEYNKMKKGYKEGEVAWKPPK